MIFLQGHLGMTRKPQKTRVQGRVFLKLNDTQAKRAYNARKDGGITHKQVYMAGVESYEAGEVVEDTWYDRLMGATCHIANEEVEDRVFIVAVGINIYVDTGYVFTVNKTYDSFYVCSPDLVYADKRGKRPCYIGTRPACEAVAAHLNGLLEEVRGE